ncbi:MAG: hypothetical protein JSS32_09315 [Verrucomicrobia bacterium]|nr:hypothetical protein [Verrucomicrobiota bacterium]
MSFAVNGLMDGMMGLVESIDGLMKNNLSQFGLGVTALLAGAGQGKLIHRQVGTEKTLNMVADFNKAIASLLGGAVGATAATMITQVVAQSLPAYSKAAVFVIGIPLRAVGSFAIGFVATAVFVVAIDGTVAAVNKIREWRQPPAELALV